MSGQKNLKEDLQYTDLMPVIDNDNRGEYVKILNELLNNNNVKNIALSGPHGSGKSSIINTYLAKYPKTKAIKLSLANFAGKEEGGVDDKVELKLLEQFFYKVDSAKIPQSRYRKIKKKYYTKYFIKTAAAFLAVGAGISFFSPNTLNMFNNTILKSGQYYGLNSAQSYIISALLTLVGVAGVAYLIKSLIYELSLMEAGSLNKENTVKEADKVSDFDKLLDELVYFFETTEYNVVFIEDLERWNNTKIFAKLRELNNILNNYDSIKRKIVFVYAVGDDMFEVEERTKFFDFIIPVIPFVNSTNSGEQLRDRLMIKDGAEKSSIFDISSDYITLISPFIEDMRTLNNICNEFKVYKCILKDLRLKDEDMFSMMLFKNLYPKEFAKLESERGVVKQAFEDKKKFVAEQNKKDVKKADELYSYSLKELLKEYSAEEIFSQEVKENKLLLFLLRNGYINENYADYINYFHPNSISVEEMNFVRSVRMQDNRENFDLKIEHTKQVCERLTAFEFSQMEVLNFDIVNYLLGSEDESEKCIELFKGLSKAGEKRFKFIEEYIDRNDRVDVFINLLCKYFKEYWKNIFEDVSDSDKKFKYLSLILRYGDIEDIIDQNNLLCFVGGSENIDDEEKKYLINDKQKSLCAEHGIAYFIESHKDSLIKLSEVAPDRMIKIIKKLNIQFRKADIKTVNKEIVDFIFENKYYADNEIMIKNIFDFYLNEGEFKKRLEMIEPMEFNKYMADGIKNLELTLNKEYVEKAWNLLDDEGRCRLLSNQLDNYLRQEISSKLALLPPEYRRLSDISRSHTEILSLDNTAYNKKLLYRLNDKKYLSIVDESENNFVVLVKKDEQSPYSNI